METITQAIQAVQRNLGALALYTLIIVAAVSVDHAVDASLGHVDNPFESGSVLAVHLGMDLFLILCSTVAQAVAFSRIGKEMDRPLWKIGGDKEAIARYFLLWLILNIVTVILSEVANFFFLEIDPDVGLCFLFLFGFANIIYIPIGVAIMFHGRVDYRSIGEYLKPFYRQLSLTLPILVFSTMVFFLWFYLTLLAKDQPWLEPVIAIVDAYFDCVIFAATWILCMYDRQNPEDLDLDF